MRTIVDTTPFYKRLAFILVSMSILGTILYAGQGILKPLSFAILLSLLLLPVTHFFRRMRLNRFFSVLFSVLLAMIIVLGVGYFLSRQIIIFFNDFESTQQRLSALFQSIQTWVSDEFGINIDAQNDYINSTGKSIDASSILGSTFVSVTAILSYLVLTPTCTFLVLYHKDQIRRFLIVVFNVQNGEKVRHILQESRVVSHQYIVGLLIEMVIVFALNSAGFLILGIRYAWFLAAAAALLNLIPYLGMLAANIISMIITFVYSENIYDVFWVAAILAAVQFIDNNFLMPWIVGFKVKINALVTLLAVLSGGVIWGVAGMFLSIPALAVLKVIFDRVEGLKPYGLLLGDESKAIPVRGIKRNRTN